MEMSTNSIHTLAGSCLTLSARMLIASFTVIKASAFPLA